MSYTLNDVTYEEQPFIFKILGWEQEMLTHAARAGLNAFNQEGESTFGQIMYVAAPKHTYRETFAAFMKSLNNGWSAYYAVFSAGRHIVWIFDRRNKCKFAFMLPDAPFSLIDNSRFVKTPDEFEHYTRYDRRRVKTELFPEIKMEPRQ